MEVENMVRKVETLNSINELGLSFNTLRLVRKMFGTDVESVIKTGRWLALIDDMHSDYADQTPKYRREFVKTLDKAGFIRHDLYPRTWCVWWLYTAMLNYYAIPIGKVSLATLVNCETFASSEEYENMPTVSDEDFRKVIAVLNSLDEKERTILVLRFGLEDGKTKDLKTVEKILDIPREHIRQLEARALRKMRAPSRSCKLPALFGFVPPAEPEPKCRFSADGTTIIADIDTDICDLDLSVRAYNCLKQFAQINTVEDILDYPEKDWLKIKNLGRKTALEIQDKMRAVGYPDFNIILS